MTPKYYYMLGWAGPPYVVLRVSDAGYHTFYKGAWTHQTDPKRIDGYLRALQGGDPALLSADEIAALPDLGVNVA